MMVVILTHMDAQLTAPKRYNFYIKGFRASMIRHCIPREEFNDRGSDAQISLHRHWRRAERWRREQS